jgi:cytochrome c-type biogenesis protein
VAQGNVAITTATRRSVFFHALAFVLGFSTVFVVLGASVAFIGFALNQYLPTFVKIGGLILIVFGLYVAGALSWVADKIRQAGGDRNPLGHAYIVVVDGLGRLMYTEGRVHVKADHRLGYLSSFVMGIFFSAGWIPCVGPVLAAIYLLASDTQTVAQGALLLLAYSAGLGIPFLITGAALGTATGVLRSMNRHMGVVSKITGLFLIFVGVLLFMDRLSLISNVFVSRFGTGLASLELGGPGASSVVTVPIAFAAGILSFLSPCVLPLIPAYIGYLSGTAVANGAGAAQSGTGTTKTPVQATGDR